MQLGCDHPIGPLVLTDTISLDVLSAVVIQTIFEGFAGSKIPVRPAHQVNGRWLPRLKIRRGVCHY
jgi:hypothetical protein